MLGKMKRRAHLVMRLDEAERSAQLRAQTLSDEELLVAGLLFLRFKKLEGLAAVRGEIDHRKMNPDGKAAMDAVADKWAEVSVSDFQLLESSQAEAALTALGA